MFCQAVYANSSLDSTKLKTHLTAKHGEHKNKSQAFFIKQREHFEETQQRFEKSMAHPSADNAIVKTTLEIAAVIMKEKKSFLLAESVVQPCLEIAAKNLHGNEAVRQVRKLPLSRDTVRRRCLDISDDLLRQLLIKINTSPCFGIQFDETTDIKSQA